MKMNKTALSAALVLAMGAGSAQADIVKFDWTGTFTMINPNNQTLVNSDFAGNSTKGHQTEITGTMVFNTSQTASQTTSFAGNPTLSLGPGAGSATVNSFNFFGGGPAVAHDITMQAIGDGSGTGTPGTLVAGNMKFDWNGTNNINVDIVLDAAGFFSADMTGLAIGDALTMGPGAVAPDYESRCVDVTFGVCTIALDDPAAGATSWVNELDGTTVNDASQFNLATTVTGGPRFMATVDGNPFAQENVTITQPGQDGILGTADDIVFTGNRHTDGISGIRMDNGPFPGFNANFDVAAMTLSGFEPAPVSAVPVPAAVWLFGSGLVGLVGVARRRKSA